MRQGRREEVKHGKCKVKILIISFSEPVTQHSLITQTIPSSYSSSSSSSAQHQSSSVSSAARAQSPGSIKLNAITGNRNIDWANYRMSSIIDVICPIRDCWLCVCIAAFSWRERISLLVMGECQCTHFVAVASGW